MIFTSSIVISHKVRPSIYFFQRRRYLHMDNHMLSFCVSSPNSITYYISRYDPFTQQNPLFFSHIVHRPLILTINEPYTSVTPTHTEQNVLTKSDGGGCTSGTRNRRRLI